MRTNSRSVRMSAQWLSLPTFASLFISGAVIATQEFFERPDGDDAPPTDFSAWQFLACYQRRNSSRRNAEAPRRLGDIHS